MRNRLFSIVFLASFFIFPAIATASSYSAGNDAYKAHNYAAAAEDFQAATSQSSGAEQAKAYYKLGLTLRKEENSVGALAAFKQASTIDPSLSFASSPDKFEQMEASVESSGSGSASPMSSAPTDVDPVATTLTAATVYVDPSMQPFVNTTTLSQIAENDDHTTAKIVVLNRLPPAELSPEQYASTLHTYLNLGSNAIIVVAMHGANGAPGGVAINAGTLTHSEATALEDRYVAEIGSGNITKGVSDLAAATTAKIDAKEQMVPNLVLDAVLIALVIFGLLIFAASRRKKAQMQTIRLPINTLRGNVLQNIEYIDNYADVLPKNNADTDQVRAYRQAAEAKFEQADKILIKATEVSELYRAQSILDKANADLAQARQFLDRATGGTSKIPGDSAVRPPDLPVSALEAGQIPQQQRGVSFFSSQPAPLAGLVPVTLNINGENRTVMATPDEADQIRSGQIPPVRAFNNNGQLVPWYNYQNYDPYRDYYSYQNQGWGGFGSGVATGFIGAELLDSLFRPNNYGGWYSPYGYSPGFGGFGGWNDYGYGYGSGFDQGYFSGQQNNDFGLENTYNQQNDLSGGASFPGSGYDQSDYGNSGGASFLGGGDRS